MAAVLWGAAGRLNSTIAFRGLSEGFQRAWAHCSVRRPTETKESTQGTRQNYNGVFSYFNSRVTVVSEAHVSMPKGQTGLLYDGFSTSASQGPYWRVWPGVWVFLDSLPGIFTRYSDLVQFLPRLCRKENSGDLGVAAEVNAMSGCGL